ncbi:MAG: sigma-70 family RNA polymerase sigma factor [Candidatus Cloacimonas sp.]
MNEQEIIAKAKTDVSAFDYLYDKYFLQIYKFVMLRVRDRDIANEVVSDVFYKAMSKLHTFKWRSVPFSSWLYRIAMNEISNYYRREERKRKLVGVLIHESDEPYGSVTYEEAQSYDFLHKYIKMLPQRDQDVIVFRYMEKKSFEEISQIFGKKEGYVRVILHRALKKLEQSLPKEVIENVGRKVS